MKHNNIIQIREHQTLLYRADDLEVAKFKRAADKTSVQRFFQYVCQKPRRLMTLQKYENNLTIHNI